MKIVIENAGAQKGFLILNHKGSWVIEAQGNVTEEEVTILQSIPIKLKEQLAATDLIPTDLLSGSTVGGSGFCGNSSGFSSSFGSAVFSFSSNSSSSGGSFGSVSQGNDVAGTAY